MPSKFEVGRAARLRKSVVPSERLIMNYDASAAPCGCTSPRTCGGVIVIAVVTTAARADGRDGIDRCLGCGARWTARRLLGDAATLLSSGARQERAA